MYFEQFYLGCLAHASYLVGSQGEAMVVDPQRDVEIYVKAAEAQGLRIAHIFETHLHADFVSGHRELAARTGANIYIGAQAQASFPHIPLQDGDEIAVGRLRVKALETPGHTPEGTCLLLTDTEKSEQPWAVLTGDTLFIGDVGRPDLSKTHSPQELAGLLYDSLHNKLMSLPAEVLVYPAHGAGSLCGRNMRAERSSTIGTERLTNYALQIPSREEFIRELTTNLPARPEYFARDAEINRQGAPALGEMMPLPEITPAELGEAIRAGVPALDVRPGEKFAAGHVPGSINIALSGQFASWAATVLGLESRPILITDTPEQIEEARVRLARVGIEDVRGYLDGGYEEWVKAGLTAGVIPEMSVAELRDHVRQGGQVVDVRRQAEWNAGHVPGADLRPLDGFRSALPEVQAEQPVAVHCKGGYRSMIACSLLKRAGHTNVVNVTGGFDAWQQAGLPVEPAVLAKA